MIYSRRLEVSIEGQGNKCRVIIQRRQETVLAQKQFIEGGTVAAALPFPSIAKAADQTLRELLEEIYFLFPD